MLPATSILMYLFALLGVRRFVFFFIFSLLVRWMFFVKCAFGEETTIRGILTAKQIRILSQNLTWNLKMMVWKMIFLFQGCILRFHVNLPGCNTSCHFWGLDFFTGSPHWQLLAPTGEKKRRHEEEKVLSHHAAISFTRIPSWWLAQLKKS